MQCTVLSGPHECGTEWVRVGLPIDMDKERFRHVVAQEVFRLYPWCNHCRAQRSTVLCYREHWFSPHLAYASGSCAKNECEREVQQTLNAHVLDAELELRAVVMAVVDNGAYLSD